MLLTWESEGLKVWDTSDKWQGYIYQPDDSERHETNVDKLMLTDNRLLTHSTSWGTEDNVARVWDLESCTCVEKMVHPDSLRLVKHLDNDLLMTAARDNRIRWWDWRTGEVKHEANAAALRIQTLEDGTLVTECPLGFRTWTEEGEEVSSFMPGGNVKFSGPLPVGGGQALVVVRPGGWKEASSQIYRWSYLTEDAPVLLAESEPKVLSLNRVDGHPVTHDARGEVTIWAPDGTQALRRFQTMERGLRWLKVVGHTLIGADYLNMSCWNVNGDLLWTREEEHGLIENIQELTPGVIAKWCVWKSQWPDESSREQLPLDPDIELFDPANGQTLRRLKGSLGPLSKLTLLESGFVLCRLVTEGVYYEWKNKFNLWSPSDELVASGVSLTEMAQTHPSALRSYLKQESSQNNEVLAHTFASYRFSDHEFNVNPCAVEVWEGANGALLGPIEKSKTHPSTLRRLRWYSNNPCSLIRVTPDGSAIIMHEGALKRLITHP